MNSDDLILARLNKTAAIVRTNFIKGMFGTGQHGTFVLGLQNDSNKVFEYFERELNEVDCNLVRYSQSFENYQRSLIDSVDRINQQIINRFMSDGKN